MASAMGSTTAAVSRSVPAQASMSPFIGQKLSAAFPITRKSADSASMRKGFKVSCMKVWPTIGLKKFETLSYLPPLTREQLLKEVEYLLRSKWIPCLEFQLEHEGLVYRENHRSPGYYDGRYWTMWKLPMFGCSDAVQVVNELDEVIKAHPDAFVRIIGFDNVRQVQCISFIAYRPPGY